MYLHADLSRLARVGGDNALSFNLNDLIRFKMHLDAQKQQLYQMLATFATEGYAKRFGYDTPDGLKHVWLVSWNKELIAKIDGIDGFDPAEPLFYLKAGEPIYILDESELERWIEPL